MVRDSIETSFKITLKVPMIKMNEVVSGLKHVFRKLAAHAVSFSSSFVLRCAFCVASMSFLTLLPWQPGLGSVPVKRDRLGVTWAAEKLAGKTLSEKEG